MYIYIYIYFEDIHVCIYYLLVCTYIKCIHICTNIRNCKYIYVYICIYIYMYIYIHIERERGRGLQRKLQPFYFMYVCHCLFEVANKL